MERRRTRRLAAGFAVCGTAFTLAACGDARIEKLATGISRDSVLAIINEGASEDSLARVYRQDSYLLPNTKGNVLLTNVLFYAKRGRKEADAPDASAETTPIVIVDGKVSGWGWTYFDSVAQANNIPVKPRN